LIAILIIAELEKLKFLAIGKSLNTIVEYDSNISSSDNNDNDNDEQLIDDCIE